MEFLAHKGAILLMGLFALGVIGCAITIPICAIKFFAILFEPGEEESKMEAHGLMPLYHGAEPTDASPPPRTRRPDAQH
jgi:hypothetical protein